VQSRQNRADARAPLRRAPLACLASPAWLAFVALGAAVLVARAAVAERQTVDDVFIFLRYARSVAEGGAYAFGPGPGPRVEGTSSVVWTLLLAAAWRAGLRGVGVAKGLSLGAAALVPFAAAAAVRRAVPGRPWLSALPALALALDADLATWAASGMDTALWTLSCVACVAVAASRRPVAAAVLSGALAWVRPEGPLFAAAAVVALARDRRSALRLAALAAAPVALLTLLRLGYFHDTVPNTFWAKMHAAPDGRDYSGLGYLASALERRPLLLLVLPAAALPVREGDGARLALAFLGAAFAFAVAAGGDWMPDRRLLVVALPLGAVAAAIGLAAVGARALPAAACAALVAEAALTFDHAVDQRWREREWVDERVAHWWPATRPLRDPYPLDWMPTHLLYTIAPYVTPGDVVAHVDVGELPYVMGDVGFLDGFGLVDRPAGRVAFAPRSQALRSAAREELFAARPAAVIVVLDESSGRPFSPAQDAVAEDPRFKGGWREIDRVPTWGEHPCVTYVRRDLAASPPEVTSGRVRRWLGSVPDVVPAF
jgi:hypothetical protein